MNLLSVEEISKSYGERVLFKGLTFGIEHGQKAALVAKNGAGKTTLMNCIMGNDNVETGRIVWRKDIRISYLSQNNPMPEDAFILDVVLDHELPEIQAVKRYNRAMELDDMDALNAAAQDMNDLDAWNVEQRIHEILEVLNLAGNKLPIGKLSGGQKKRIALAKILIAEPEFLVLDEPTNHLDLDMIEWLENYLSKSSSTIFMVTHDRYFLENVCDTIYELDDNTLYKYKGNFSYFLEKKAERQEQFGATIDKARNLMRKELEWVRRQPKARSTKQKARLDAFEDTKAVATQRVGQDEMDIHIKTERMGSKILEFHKIGKSYPDKKIINDFSYVFKNKERVGILGKNGVGKSTFLNMIIGDIEPDKGKIVIGETVVFGYYRQENIHLPNDKRVIEVITDIAEFIPLEKGKQMSAAQFLERFLFPRNMHWNYVEKLSGGERNRLKLMMVLMQNPNFLILDEPTNDFDIYTMTVLEDYLSNYPGCLLIVSHDRYFMDKLVDHVFYFTGDGEIKDIMGNYTAYHKARITIQQEQAKAKITQSNAAAAAAKVPKPEITANQEKQRKLSFKEKLEFENIEQEIADLEEKKEKLTQKLYDTSLAGDEMNAISMGLSEVVAQIDAKTERWIALSDFQS
jgi:ATP-binding cassette subfamily F protein uup